MRVDGSASSASPTQSAASGLTGSEHAAGWGTPSRRCRAEAHGSDGQQACVARDHMASRSTIYFTTPAAAQEEKRDLEPESAKAAGKKHFPAAQPLEANDADQILPCTGEDLGQMDLAGAAHLDFSKVGSNIAGPGDTAPRREPGKKRASLAGCSSALVGTQRGPTKNGRFVGDSCFSARVDDAKAQHRQDAAIVHLGDSLSSLNVQYTLGDSLSPLNVQLRNAWRCNRSLQNYQMFFSLAEELGRLEARTRPAANQAADTLSRSSELFFERLFGEFKADTASSSNSSQARVASVRPYAAGGRACVEFDLCRGAHFDITHPAVMRTLEQWIKTWHC